ncbi:hypothetical protein BVY03_00700 [bacterium K02(2017)]|nr:hypothetical protein BVY03_00700 [bacterium K02(2017)]
MSESKKDINLFHYFDYREFLKDFYQQAKKSRAGFSLRSFSQKAGFGSSNFFKLVMDGDRNLTSKSLVKFMRGLNLNKQETEFFKNLVFFNQAKSHADKDFYYQKMLQSQKFNKLKPVDKIQYELYSTWYHPVILELISSKAFDGTILWLKNKIVPELSDKQIEKSIKILEKLEFIKKDKNNRWKQSTPLITTGAEATSLVLINYHQHLLKLTHDQLTKVPAATRDVSAMTLGVPKERIAEIKKKVQEFRNDIMKLVSTDETSEEVILLNIQLLPVTKSWDEKK